MCSNRDGDSGWKCGLVWAVKGLPGWGVLSFSLCEYFLKALFFWRTVADDGSRLLHSAGRGQLGASAGADKTSGASHPEEFIGQVPSLTSCSHTQTQKCSSLSEPEACFIYINPSDWTAYFSRCHYTAAGRSSCFLVYFPGGLLKLHHIEWGRRWQVSVWSRKQVCCRFPMVVSRRTFFSQLPHVAAGRLCG